MTNRRDFLLSVSATLATTALAGCTGSTTGRGDTLDSSDTFEFKEIGGTEPIYSIGITAPHYCELTYQGEIRKPDEGFEEVGKVDILVISEPVYREILLSGSESEDSFAGLDADFLENPPTDRIESASQFNVTGEFEGTGQMPAGNYRLLVVNQGDRNVEFTLDTETYEYTREKESVSCNQSSSPLDVQYISVTGRYPYILTYHINVNDETGGEYSLSMNLKSAREELSLSSTHEPDVCGTSFVYYDEIDMEPDVGDELRAEVTVSKDGEEFGTKSIEFTANERWTDI